MWRKSLIYSYGQTGLSFHCYSIKLKADKAGVYVINICRHLLHCWSITRSDEPIWTLSVQMMSKREREPSGNHDDYALFTARTDKVAAVTKIATKLWLRGWLLYNKPRVTQKKRVLMMLTSRGELTQTNGEGHTLHTQLLTISLTHGSMEHFNLKWKVWFRNSFFSFGSGEKTFARVPVSLE